MHIFEYVIPRDLKLRAIHILINTRLLKPYLALFRRKDEVSLRVEQQFFSASKTQRDGLRVRTGSYDEVIFQLVLVAVVSQIHAGIDIAILHPAKQWHVRTPFPRVVANEVVGLAGKLLKPLGL